MSLLNQQKLDVVVKIMIMLTIILSLFLSLTHHFPMRLGSDVNPLIQAVNDYSVGIDPYRHIAQSMFVYHPYVLNTLAGINHLVPLHVFLFCVYALSIAWFGYQSYRWLIGQMPSTVPLINDMALMLLVSLSFGSVTIVSLLCGNLSAYFHLILIGLIFHYATQKNVLTLFVLGLTIVLFSVVKPYFLAYILFYFLVFKKIHAVLTAGIICICTGLIWLSGSYFLPDLYERFASALQYQLLVKDDLGAFSSLRIMGPILGIKVAFIAHLVVVCMAMYTLLVIGPSKTVFMKKPANQLLIMILLIIFINPRLVFYDFYVTIFLMSYLVYINCPRRFNRIYLPGLLIALFSQLVVHPTRWVILAYCCVALTFLMAIVLKNKSRQTAQAVIEK
jgi:hypothetical protein